MKLSDKDLKKLLAYIDGRLSPRARIALEQKLDENQKLLDCYEALRQTRSLLGEMGREKDPDINYSEVEAKIHWCLAKDKEIHSLVSKSRRPWKLAFSAALSLMLILVVGVVWLYIENRNLNASQRTVVNHYPAQKPLHTPKVLEKNVPAQRLAALAVMIKGNAFIISANKEEKLPLTMQRPILPGDRIITDSGTVILQWENGTGACLNKNSELHIDELTNQSQRLRVLAGTINFEVQKGQARQFNVRARTLSIDVLGTRFSVSLEHDATHVIVTEGKVKSHKSDDQNLEEVFIEEGQRLSVFTQDQRQELKRIALKEKRLYLPQWNDVAQFLAQTGILSIESAPSNADLELDQKHVGKTNLRLRSSLGRHQISVLRQGKLIKRYWVNVDHETTMRISLALKNVSVQKKKEADISSHLYQLFKERSVLLRSCYERQLKHNRFLSGRMLFHVDINKAGRVKRVKVIKDTLRDENVQRCTIKVIKRWNFPIKQEASIEYPFIFRPH